MTKRASAKITRLKEQQLLMEQLMRGEEGGRGGDYLGSGHPQKNIQSPDRLNKAPTDYTKSKQTKPSPKKTIQSLGILDKDMQH